MSGLMSGYSKRGFTELAVAARRACFTGGVVELTHSQAKVTKILMEIASLRQSHLRTKASLFQHDRQIFPPITRSERTVMYGNGCVTKKKKLCVT